MMKEYTLKEEIQLIDVMISKDNTATIADYIEAKNNNVYDIKPPIELKNICFIELKTA